MKDKNGVSLKVGDAVLTDEPIIGDDLFNHSFVGVVDGFRGEYVSILDGDGYYFEIEPNRLEIE